MFAKDHIQTMLFTSQTKDSKKDRRGGNVHSSGKNTPDPLLTKGKHLIPIPHGRSAVVVFLWFFVLD